MTSPAPPSQRAELLTKELESAMAKLRDCAKWGPNSTINRVTADEAASLLQHIAALTQRVGAQQWQPIETAPKDGTEILAWRADAGVMLIRWDAPMNFLTEREAEQIGDCAEQYDWFYADFVSGDRLEGELVPTHWQPLPQPPAALSQEPRNG